jgi:endonuclease YncB( thermonuclease family)
VTIHWSEGDEERIRILGIDTPETRNIRHNLPYDQSFGLQATAFAKGAFATATEVELLRADMTDGYGRTLGYLFVNDRNYSVLIVRAHLAAETVSHYGDNGFPEESQAVLEAARAAGPVAFEPPYQFRRRMRELTEWMRDQGMLPEEPQDD